MKGSGRLSHDTHEQRRTVCSGEHKEEGAIQHKIYFFGRRGGHGIHRHHGERSGGAAILVNGHPCRVLGLGQVGGLLVLGQGGEIRFFPVKHIGDPQRVQALL